MSSNDNSQTDDPPINPDIGGMAVCITNVVVTFCLRILITWSPDVDVGIQVSLLQIYSMLLSTLFSVNRQQLSLEDANFVISVVFSPLTIYLVAASACNLCGIKTSLYGRIESYPRVVCCLGALVLPFWLALTMISVLSSGAFTDSTSHPFKTWLIFLLSRFMNVLEPGFFFTVGRRLYWNIYYYYSVQEAVTTDG